MDELEDVFVNAGESEPVKLIKEWAESRKKQMDADLAWAKKMEECFAGNHKRKVLGNLVP